jgi:hypothetical protein
MNIPNFPAGGATNIGPQIAYLANSLRAWRLGVTRLELAKNYLAQRREACPELGRRGRQGGKQPGCC